MDRSQLFVSVIIPVYNEPELLKKCLDSLAHQTYPSPNHEVIVVDNNSDVPVREEIEPHDNVKLTKEKKTGSYAARNKALEQANGEILAFTDADCIPEKSWLERGVSKLAEKDADMLGGKVQIFPKNNERPNGFEVVDMITAFPQKTYVHQRDFAVTANMLSKRKVFDSVGWFRDELESGGDMEFGQRAVSAGFNLVYEPDCIVHHPARATLTHHRMKIARVTRGKKVKGHIEMEKDWRESSKQLVPPLLHSIKTTFYHDELPFRSKLSGALSLTAIHYVKELEDRKARKEIENISGTNT